ncbi:hypothetical protein T492DRAFT_1144956, partial [Pavlovales sp. CCMP2436]
MSGGARGLAPWHRRGPAQGSAAATHLGTASATIRLEHTRSLAFLNDAFAQLEALLLARTPRADGVSTVPPPRPEGGGRAPSALAPPLDARRACLDRAALCDDNELRTQGQLLQRWLSHFRTDLTPVISEHLVAVAVSMRERIGPVDVQPAARVMRGSAQMHAPSERQMQLQLVLLFVLQAVLGLLQHTGGRDPLSVSLVPFSVLDFCFEQIGPSHLPVVRETASRCVGLLARAAGHLVVAVKLYAARLEKVRASEHQREFAPYQRATCVLPFGWAEGEGGASATLDYLRALSAAMGRIERRVLRTEVCSSLDKQLRRLLARTEGSAWFAFEARGGKPLAEFWALFGAIHAHVLRWARKARHAPFCFDLAASMLCLGDPPFFVKQRKEVLGALVARIKKEGVGGRAMQRLLRCLRELPHPLLAAEPAGVSDALDKLWLQLLPRKSGFSSNELPAADAKMATAVLAEVGRVQPEGALHIAFDVIRAQPSAYAVEARAAVLAALPLLARDPAAAAALAARAEALATAVLPLIADQTAELLLCAAVACAPLFGPLPTATAESHLVARLCRFAAAGAGAPGGCSVAHAASLALLARLPSCDRAAALQTCATLLERLARASGVDDDELSLAFSLIRDALGDVAARARVSGGAATSAAEPPTGPTRSGAGGRLGGRLVGFVADGPVGPEEAQAWVQLRLRTEGIAIAWAHHPKPWAAVEAFELLQVAADGGIALLEGPAAARSLSLARALRAADVSERAQATAAAAFAAAEAGASVDGDDARSSIGGHVGSSAGGGRLSTGAQAPPLRSHRSREWLPTLADASSDVAATVEEEEDHAMALDAAQISDALPLAPPPLFPLVVREATLHDRSPAGSTTLTN